MEEQACILSDNPEYDAFVEKFKPKKTTDDCYTPPLIYETVRDWACQEYSINPEKIVRPFYPGGDYENYEYPSGCVVLDNPPFSILSKICEFYLDREIPFFLFCPSLTAFGWKKIAKRMNHIFCDAVIEYENGVKIQTSFVTSFGENIVAQTQPQLTQLINNAVETLRKEKRKTLPKYEYPDHVVTAAMLQKYSHYGIDWKIRKDDCIAISMLDAQNAVGKKIFGDGLLLSNRQALIHTEVRYAAAERAAAERDTAQK